MNRSIEINTLFPMGKIIRNYIIIILSLSYLAFNILIVFCGMGNRIFWEIFIKSLIVSSIIGFIIFIWSTAKIKEDLSGGSGVLLVLYFTLLSNYIVMFIFHNIHYYDFIILQYNETMIVMNGGAWIAFDLLSFIFLKSLWKNVPSFSTTELYNKIAQSVANKYNVSIVFWYYLTIYDKFLMFIGIFPKTRTKPPILVLDPESRKSIASFDWERFNIRRLEKELKKIAAN